MIMLTLYTIGFAVLGIFGFCILQIIEQKLGFCDHGFEKKEEKIAEIKKRIEEDLDTLNSIINETKNPLQRKKLKNIAGYTCKIKERSSECSM